MANTAPLSHKIGRTVFALVFAVGFTAGGVFAGIFPLCAQVSNWWVARSYVAVPATVLTVELESLRRFKGGPGYLAKAEFAYRYRGRDYRSTRIGTGSGGDNIDDYQQAAYARLERAYTAGDQVSLWVDPDRPERAMYDREIRWKSVVLLIPFALLFPAVGIGAWYAILRIWRPAGPAAHAWEEGRPPIRADGKALMSMGLMAAFWNILSWPIATLAVSGAVRNGKWIGLVALVFPLAGLMLMYTVWAMLRKRWRIGKPVLEYVHAGVPGTVPLQGRIRFDPGLGMRRDPAQLMHPVSLEVRLVEEQGGRYASNPILWQQQVVDTSLARGAETVDFSVPLPLRLPAPRMVGGRHARVCWLLILKTGDAELGFELPSPARR